MHCKEHVKAIPSLILTVLIGLIGVSFSGDVKLQHNYKLRYGILANGAIFMKQLQWDDS